MNSTDILEGRSELINEAKMQYNKLIYFSIKKKTLPTIIVLAMTPVTHNIAYYRIMVSWQLNL